MKSENKKATAVKKKKVGLVLGAGGARGMCHLGVLRALHENGVKVHCVTGSSMGSLVGGLFAAGVSLEKMDELSAVARQGFIMDLNFDWRQRDGLFRARRVMKMLTEAVGDLLIEDCPIKYRTTGVDVESAELFIFKKGVLRDAIRASMAIPGVFTPWEVNGRTYMDGGGLCRLPVQAARDMGATAVIAVDALGRVRPTAVPSGIFGMVQRYNDIVDWEIAKNRIETNSADVLITPDMGDKSQFIFKHNEEAVEAGYKATVEAMPEILKVVNNFQN